MRRRETGYGGKREVLEHVRWKQLADRQFRCGRITKLRSHAAVSSTCPVHALPDSQATDPRLLSRHGLVLSPSIPLGQQQLPRP